MIARVSPEMLPMSGRPRFRRAVVALGRRLRLAGGATVPGLRACRSSRRFKRLVLLTRLLTSSSHP
jgi:hypothetical protein